MCCGLWLVAIVLAIATWMAIVGGQPRVRIHLVVPLIVATLAWTGAAILELCVDVFGDPAAFRLDLLVVGVWLLATSTVCGLWILVYLAIAWYRSRR
jgi:hypothetical protein